VVISSFFSNMKTVFALASTAVSVSDSEWAAWKQEHGKVYNGDDEEIFRHGVFTANLAEAAKLQEMNPLAEFGSTMFSDWTKEEFKTHLTNYVPANSSVVPEMDLSELPERVAASKDWTGTATTPVKDQGQCGSCWAESAVEQIESDLMLSGAGEVVLAVQELVDCTASGAGSYRGGCSGGNTGPAYNVVQSLGGLERESSYPYTARDGTCKFNRREAAVTISGYQSVGRGSETSMKRYISSSGPLSICVDANSWQSYRGGVLSSCGQSVDHCVQLVGYEGDAWKVRNSWGARWGESGHIRIAIGRDLCAISSEPTKVTGARVVSTEVQV